jgi:hypothetical protein
MSFDALGDMNWLAVIVATVAYFALGGLWFSKLMFANAWQRAMGWEETEEESYGPEFYIGPFVTCLLSTIAVGMLAVATGSDTLAEGLVLGLVVGVGVCAAVLFVTGYFDQRKQSRWCGSPSPRATTWSGCSSPRRSSRPGPKLTRRCRGPSAGHSGRARSGCAGAAC